MKTFRGFYKNEWDLFFDRLDNPWGNVHPIKVIWIVFFWRSKKFNLLMNNLLRGMHFRAAMTTAIQEFKK